MLKMVTEDPFVPIAWQKDHRGMQGTEYFEDPIGPIEGDVPMPALQRKGEWLNARAAAVNQAVILSEMGITKQLCNRLLEPFMWHTAIITATEWENFFYLRCPDYPLEYTIYESDQVTVKEKGVTHHRSRKDWLAATTDEYQEQHAPKTEMDWLLFNKGQADIHMMATAEAMWDAKNESKPKELDHNGWHIPFGDNISADLSRWEGVIDTTEGWGKDLTPLMIKVATARCARVSYMNFEGKDDYKADVKLHDMLLNSGHYSPLEHCAKAWPDSTWFGNFRGFQQYRKMIPGENRVC